MAMKKIRCEAGTYAWMQKNCPDIPIPRLYGFATSTGEAVSLAAHVSGARQADWGIVVYSTAKLAASYALFSIRAPPISIVTLPSGPFAVCAPPKREPFTRR